MLLLSDGDEAAVGEVGIAGPAAVGRDTEMTGDGWGAGDFDAEKILAYGDCRWIGGDGGDIHKFDEDEDELDSF